MFLLKFCLNHLHKHLISGNSNSPIFYTVSSWTGDHSRSILLTPLEVVSWQDAASQQSLTLPWFYFEKLEKTQRLSFLHESPSRQKTKPSDSKICLVNKTVPTVLNPHLQPTVSQSLMHFCFLRCLLWKIFFAVCSFYPCLCSQSAWWCGGCNFYLF